MRIPAVAQFGPYEIQGPLGAGGMGEVYRAIDRRLGRAVAIKTLSAHLSTDPDALARFDRESRTIAALSHPNILAVFDVGRHEGLPYAVLENAISQGVVNDPFLSARDPFLASLRGDARFPPLMARVKAIWERL